MNKVIAIAILITFFCSGCKYFEKKRLFSKGADTMLNYAAEMEESPVDSSQLYGVEQGQSEADRISDSLKNLYQKGSTMGTDHIYMVVGCFLIPQNADEYAEKIRKMGYNSEIILRADGFHMVTANSYSSLKAGTRDLQKYRDDVTKDAWLWVKR